MSGKSDSLDRLSQRYCRELLKISLAINAELDLKELLDMIVHSVRDLTSCDDASIVLWCPRQACFKIGASTNIGDTVSRRVRQSGGASRWVVDHGKPVVVKDTRRDPFVANPMIPQAGILSYTGVPIKQADKVTGVLYALYLRVHAATSDELWVMEQAAASAAAAIHNASLVDSLRNLNAFKSAMTRMLVHDLRNPLTTLMGGVELMQLELEETSPEFQKWLSVIGQQAARMDGMITSILTYDKINSIEEIERKPLDLNLLVREAAADLKEAAVQKSQRLKRQVSAQPLWTYGNRVMLREAVENLLMNAIKYTPAGGSITVRTRRTGKYCLLTVSDTGPGIHPKDQKKLFQPFVRLEHHSGERGSGLGLCLVKLIIERHAGEVAVESTPGEGSTFSIRLPLFTEGD